MGVRLHDDREAGLGWSRVADIPSQQRRGAACMERDGSDLDGTNQFVDHAGERGSVGGAVTRPAWGDRDGPGEWPVMLRPVMLRP